MNERAPVPAKATTRTLTAAQLGAAAGTVLAALAGGTAARLAGLPLPWLLGPLFATAAASLAGAPIAPIRHGRTAGQVVIGGAIGAQFTKAIILNLISLAH